MNIKIQILSLIYSFFMGFILYLLSILNYHIVINKKNIWKYILTILLVIDFVLIYLVGIYYINNGIVHIYFIIMVIIAFLASVKLLPIAKKNDNNFKDKWYN